MGALILADFCLKGWEQGGMKEIVCLCMATIAMQYLVPTDAQTIFCFSFFAVTEDHATRLV